MALALGVNVDLITRVSEEYDKSVFEGLDVQALPAAVACRYANRYDADGNRTQLLLSDGEPIDLAGIDCSGADACILAPAYHELEGQLACAAPLRAAFLQGVLRSREGERVVFHGRPLGEALRLSTAESWAFLSVEDTADAEGLARELSRAGRNVFLTRSHHGATRFDRTCERQFEAIPAASVADPTGAGDCFAAAFVVRLAETGDTDEASRFALAAGSLAVEGVGIAGIPGRNAIERRLEREAA